MSPRLHEVGLFIRGHIRERGYAPSRAEIGARFGVGETRARAYVRTLERLDVLRRVYGKRGIVMVEDHRPGPLDRIVVQALIEVAHEVEQGLMADDLDRVRRAGLAARGRATEWLAGVMRLEEPR